MNRFGGKLAQTALISIAIIILLFWVNWWFINRLAWVAKEQALHDRLVATASELARTIESDISILVFDYASTQTMTFSDGALAQLPQTLAYDQLTTHVRRARLNADLSSLLVLDRDERVLLDAAGKYELGDPFEIDARDRQPLERALAGELAASPTAEYHTVPEKAVYVPLRNSARQIVAVLCLETARRYFGEIRTLRNWIALTGAIGTLLLLTVGLVQYRTLRNMAEIERAMAQEDRLRSLGTLAAGLAHELRNPLGIMRATAEEIREETAGQPNVAGLPEDLIEEIERLNALIEQVLQFARPNDRPGLGNQSCQVEPVLEAVLQLIRKNMKSQSIELVLRQDDPDLTAAIDANELRQVLLNLLLNATDAVAENSAADKKGRIEVHATPARNQRLLVEIRDNGPGIAAEHLDRVFDPFFSTKPDGTGLGLSISRRIVERAGGALELESAPGKGATARVTLRAASAGA